jgi:hypothetical protein
LHARRVVDEGPEVEEEPVRTARHGGSVLQRLRDEQGR